jgi:hypothetical protein
MTTETTEKGSRGVLKAVEMASSKRRAPGLSRLIVPVLPAVELLVMTLRVMINVTRNKLRVNTGVVQDELITLWKQRQEIAVV